MKIKYVAEKYSSVNQCIFLCHFLSSIHSASNQSWLVADFKCKSPVGELGLKYAINIENMNI